MHQIHVSAEDGMTESSEGEEDLYVDRGMVGKGKRQMKGVVYDDGDVGPYKPPVIEGYHRSKKGQPGLRAAPCWPASVPPAPMAHFTPYAMKGVAMEAPIEEEVESEDAQEYEDEEDEDNEEVNEVADEEDVGEDDSEADSGYTLSQETARFNLQQMPVSQQIGIQIFAPDRAHLLPPRPGAQMQQHPVGAYPQQPRGMFPPPLPPQPLPTQGYPQQLMYQNGRYAPAQPVPYHGGYSGQYQAPVKPAGYPGYPPTPGYTPIPPGLPQPQPLKSASQASMVSQHTRSHSSMHSQSQTTIADESSPFKHKSSKGGFGPKRDSEASEYGKPPNKSTAPMINGIPYGSPLSNLHPNHNYHAPEPEQGDDTGFIDATQGNYQHQHPMGPYIQYQHWHNRYYAGMQALYRRPSQAQTLRSYHHRDQEIVEIAHLSMNMLRNDPRAQHMSPPTHERKFTVLSHNLSEAYREKHDVVKENNFKNSHSHWSQGHGHENRFSTDPNRIIESQHDNQGEIVAGSSATSPSQHTSAMHDPRGEVGDNRGITEQSVTDGRQDDARSEGQGSRSVESESRILNRPQSARSLIRSNSETSEKHVAMSSRRSSRSSSRKSRPSSAVDRTSGSRTEIKRPMSAQSQPRSESGGPGRPSQARSGGRPGTPRSETQGRADTPRTNNRTGMERPSNGRSRSSTSSKGSRSSKRSGDGKPSLSRPDGRSIGDRPGSGRSDRRDSRDRPVSRKSHSSTRSVANDNNNNRGSVKTESARTYATEGVETLERTPRNQDVVEISGTIETENEEILYAAGNTGDPQISVTKEEEGLEITPRTAETEGEEVVDGKTLTNGWEVEEQTAAVEKETVDDRENDESGARSELRKGEDVDDTTNTVETHVRTEEENEVEIRSDEGRNEVNDSAREAHEIEERVVEGGEDEESEGQILNETAREELSPLHLDEDQNVNTTNNNLETKDDENNVMNTDDQFTDNVDRNNNSEIVVNNIDNADVQEAAESNTHDTDQRDSENPEPESVERPREEAGEDGFEEVRGQDTRPKCTRSVSRQESSRSIHNERPPSRGRPISARSIPRPDSARPDSARSVTKRPMSARSIKSRPVSARSVKSQASGIEFIDNLSRKSSVHISSEFKSNALKNQGYDIEEEEGRFPGEGAERDPEEVSSQSSRGKGKRPKKGMLNNGSIPDLRQKGEKRGKAGRDVTKNRNAAGASNQGGEPPVNQVEAQ